MKHFDRGVIKPIGVECNGSFFHLQAERPNHVGMSRLFVCHRLPEVTIIRKTLCKGLVEPTDQHFILSQRFDHVQGFFRHVHAPSGLAKR
jgi:hypothetical protein